MRVEKTWRILSAVWLWKIQSHPKRSLTKISNGDKLVTMKLQQRLKELIMQEGLRKVARQLGIDHASLYRSLDSDLRWSRIKSILDLLGYDFKIAKKGGKKSKSKKPREGKKEVI